MLKIRLQRHGRRNKPSFRMVVIDSKSGPNAGNIVEQVGSYNNRELTLKKDRITYWMSQGVQLTDRVHNILITESVIEGTKKNVLPKKSPIKKEVEEKPEVKVEEAKTETPAEEPKVEEAKTETPAEEPKVEEAQVETPAEEPKVEESKDDPTPTPEENPVAQE